MSHFKDEAQKMQFNTMVKEGKKPSEIIAYFKSTYQIELPASTIYAAKSQMKHKTSPAKTKNSPKKALGGGTEENVVKDILSILSQIHSGYKQVFKHLRLELIKSRAQVHEMMKGAGVAVTDEDKA